MKALEGNEIVTRRKKIKEIKRLFTRIMLFLYFEIIAEGFYKIKL